jgi:hypothetical protein
VLLQEVDRLHATAKLFENATTEARRY